MIDYYILKGHRIVKTKNVLEFGNFLESKYRIVEQVTLPNGIWISTVFLGIDHGFNEGRPVLFETMVFKDKIGEAKVGDKKYNLREDVEMRRYCTWKEAEEGHAIMVRKWKRKKI